MAFGQPYVQDESGQIIGNAITNAVQNFVAMRRYRQQLGMQQGLEMYQNPGLHFGAMPAGANQDIPLQTSALPDVQNTPTAFQKNINDALSRGVPQQPKQPPGPAITNAADAALAPTRYTPFPGGYIDRGEQMQRMRLNLIMGAMGKGLASQYEYQFDPSKQAAAGMNTARGNYFATMAARGDEREVPGVGLVRVGADGSYRTLVPSTGSNAQPRTVETSAGIMQVGPGGKLTPLTTPDGTTAMPYVRPSSADAEPPAHRDARQGFEAVSKQISDNAQQIGQLTRQIQRGAPDEFSTPADSAAYNARVAPLRAQLQTLQQRGDSLSAVRDRMGAALTGATGVSTAPPPRTTPPLGLRGSGGAGGAPGAGPGNPDIVRAQQQLSAILSNPNVTDVVKQQARAAYAKRLQRIQGGGSY